MVECHYMPILWYYYIRLISLSEGKHLNKTFLTVCSDLLFFLQHGTCFNNVHLYIIELVLMLKIMVIFN